MAATPEHLTLRRPFEPKRDHHRWGRVGAGSVILLIYGDFQCPYCRELRQILDPLRHTLGDRFVYAFRHFPNERSHPGAEFASLAAEAAGRQGRFWEMYDALLLRAPPLTHEDVLDAARSIPLDMDRLERDLQRAAVRNRVAEGLADGRRDGVAVTPTIFIDRRRYDGA